LPYRAAPEHIPRAKVTIPRFPPAFVHRAEPRGVLDAVDPQTVILVCAPAGYGKTLALADWVRHTPKTDTAWVSLDRDDNDAERLWFSIIHALGRCPAIPSESPLRQMDRGRPVVEPAFLAALVDALDELPVPVRLVLDDLHELTNAQSLHGIETLIRHHPAGLRLVLGSRLDPTLPLSRLRLEDRLFELRPPQLRFSEADAAALLEMSGVRLEPPQVAALVTRTEGWAAGLRLAALSLRDVADPDRFVADFGGDDQPVADYLFGEILSRLTPEKVDFLRAISICDNPTAGLAATVSGRTDAGRLLDVLERETALVSSTDRERRAYRIQPLLRTHLRADLDRRRPDLAAALHAAAADWYAAQARPTDALEHAAAAGDAARTEQLLHRFAVPLTMSGDDSVLDQALSSVRQEGSTDVWLALVAALLHLDAAETEEASRDLARANAAWPKDAAPAMLILRRIIELRLARMVGDLTAALQAAAGISRLQVDEPDLHTLALLEQGTAQLQGPDRQTAHHNVELALALAGRRGWDRITLRCLLALAAIAGWDGDYVGMRRLADDAVSLATTRGWQTSAWCSSAYAMRAYSALLRLEPAEALRQAQLATESGGELTASRRLLAVGMIRGSALFDSGDRTNGLREMQNGRAEHGHGPLMPEQCAALAPLEYRAALSLGRAVAARTVLGWAATQTRFSGDLRLMRAWGHLAAGHARASRRVLRPLLDGQIRLLARVNEVEVWLLEASLALAADERTTARRALATALRVASAAQVLRPFALAEPALRDLLASQLGSFGAEEPFAERVLGTVSALVADRARLDLTERELTVLQQLPSLRSLEEIANELNVSLNTVKTHVRAIYAKLGVGSRRNAVLAARHHGIL
jgi:LuxR family maltose regulon positive regulatory protein